MNFGKKITVATIALIISSILLGSLFVSAAPEDPGVGTGDYEARIAELEAEIVELTILAGTNRELLDFLEEQWIPGPQGEIGPEGPQGPQGEQGEPGFGVEPIGYLAIPAAAFNPVESDYVYYNTGGFLDNYDEHVIVLVAPVYLPHGVQINNLTMYAGDIVDGEEVQLDLYRSGDGGGLLASTSSVDSVISITFDDSIGQVVDNTDSCIYLEVTIPYTGSAYSLGFYQAVIEYEYT